LFQSGGMSSTFLFQIWGVAFFICSKPREIIIVNGYFPVRPAGKMQRKVSVTGLHKPLSETIIAKADR
jgi:hypothetical protein